jgi:outer membrane protein assembly factor BamB/3',5'-cyclic AMP phosphodiesterase CpdA
MRVSTLLFLLVLAARASADFSFVHTSDTHFGAGQNHEIDAEFFREISNLTPRPAFVVNTGDVCEVGFVEEYDLYRQAIRHLSIPIYNAPGNHDVRWNPLGKEGYTRGVGQPLFQSWDYENVHFVTLDSTVLLNHWGHISRRQLEWLKQDLATVGPERPVVIGFHHWIGRDTLQVDNERALLDVVRPFNVVLWLQGHGHSDIKWSIDGVPAMMQKGLYQGSYSVVTVTDESMSVRRRSWQDQRRRGNELVRDKSIPTTRQVEWEDVYKNIPLKRRPREVGRSDASAESRPEQFRDAPKPAWEVDVGGEVQSRLHLYDGILYLPSMGNDLVALDARTGCEIFRVKTADSVYSSPHVKDGVVYFGSADHHVYAADAKTGAIKWKTKTGGAVLAWPNVARGVVCAGSTDTKIYGLEASTGSIRWTVQGRNMYQSKTATDGERFFVGGWDNRFRCIDATSGTELWVRKLGKSARNDTFSAYSPAIASPAVGDGKVFISTNDGILHALDIASGDEVWRIDWQKMGYSSPLYRDGKVYCALGDEGKVFCADANTGAFLWNAEAGSVIYDSSFCYGAVNVFIVTVSGVMCAFDAHSGKRVWQYRLPPGHVLASPVADQERVYIGSLSGKVTALPVR